MANNHDPYNDVAPQTNQEFTYSYGLGQKAIFLVNLGACLFFIWFTLSMYLQASRFEQIYGIFFILLLGIGLFFQVKQIHCNNELIQVRYWVRPSKSVSWLEISKVKVNLNRGIWCYVFTRNQCISAIMFPLGMFNVETQMKHLVKTIVEKAQLSFISGNRLGEAEYRRVENLINPGK